jgi:Lecithin retinol acyltransferase
LHVTASLVEAGAGAVDTGCVGTQLARTLEEQFSPGDHLEASRWPHSHHGIYVGQGYVVHYTGPRKRDGAVCLDTLEVFAGSGGVRVVEYAAALPDRVVVRRALRRVGETKYDLIFENCEHFATWCKTGKSKSQQVRTAAASLGGAGAAAGATAFELGAVVALGEAAALSGGAALMRGLAAVGGAVGGGAAAGLTVLAGGPAAVATVAVHQALPDDPTLPQVERTARRVGRIAGTAGAAAGTATALGAVSALGVPGLAGVGITTGLAELGAAVGGGMFAGIGVAVALPVVVGGGLAFFAYRALRKRRR